MTYVVQAFVPSDGWVDVHDTDNEAEAVESAEFGALVTGLETRVLQGD